MDDLTRRQIISGALKNFKYKPKERSELDRLMDKAMQTTTTVRGLVIPVLQAGGYKDKLALQELITRAYLDLFCHFSHDELLNIVVLLHTQIMMEVIESDPAGTGKPDLLSGESPESETLG